VDLASGHIHDGDSVHSELSKAYASLLAAVQARRDAIDGAFATRLADDVASDSEPAEALVVESFARRVLAPVVRASRSGGHPLLFLLIDGASAAIAADLAEQLRARAWVEHDPVVDVPGPPRRRAMMSALPSLTTVSRGSLFAGELVELGQGEERSRFAGHQFWNGAAVRLFHKDGLRGEAGTPLGTELTEALADPDVHVAVVVNTIDDRLREDRPVSNWQLDELLGMEELLASARVNGRAVVIASDHGHFIDRDSVKVAAPDALSARHRAGTTAPKAGEVALAGRRVVAPGQRIVALWDTGVRYGNRQAGYHGGGLWQRWPSRCSRSSPGAPPRPRAGGNWVLNDLTGGHSKPTATPRPSLLNARSLPRRHPRSVRPPRSPCAVRQNGSKPPNWLRDRRLSSP